MKKEAKKLLAYVMALSVMVSAILSGSLPAQAATLSPTENDNISISKNEDGITVYTLTSNVTDGLSLTLADGETVILDGKNFSVSGRADTRSYRSTPALTLSGNGTLILKNIQLYGGNGCNEPSFGTYYNGSAAVTVNSEDVSLILQDTVTMTGGNAGAYPTNGNSGTDGSPGMDFKGDSLIVDSASDVSIIGSNGYDGYYHWDDFIRFGYSASGSRGADGLQLSSGSLTVHSGAKLTLTGGNGGKNNDNRVSSGNGGNAMSFNGTYYTAASDANVTFNAGKAGSITSDSDADKAGSDGTELSYTNGLFQNQNLLESALSDDDETIAVTLHYPDETQTWYAKNGSKLNTSKLPDSEPYNTDGWYTDDSLTNSAVFPYTLEADTDLYAKCTLKTFQISFITDDDSITIPKQDVDYSASATKPTEVSKTGYTLDGWYTDKDCTTAYDFSSKVTGDITLYAKWNINAYTVSFDSNDGSSVAAQSVNYNTSASKPADPSMTGYTFAGWFTDKDCTTAYDFSSKVTGDITLYAKWNINAYTVSFDSNGGSSVAAQSVDYNTTASKPADPSKTGYTFADWFTDKDGKTAYDFSSKVTGDITLYAKWNINSYKVSFESNGGSSVAAQSVAYNTTASKPADPSKTGYTFADWFTDKDCTKAYDFSSKVTGNITLYAKWNINSYKVSFESNGGSSVAAQSVTYNTAASKPTDPSKTGYNFAGWFTDQDCKTAYDFSSKVTGDITLYAKWIKIPDQSSNTPKKYKVTLNATSIPLQKGKSTTAVKATLTKGDSITKWASSNKKVATVDKNGKITAKKTGTATITVTTKKGATASVKVKVQKGKVTTKKLTVTNVTNKKLTLKKGKTFTIKTSVTPITSPDKISYASSNKKIVTVDKKGKLKAVKKGTATITVKSGKKTVKFDVTVTK